MPFIFGRRLAAIRDFWASGRLVQVMCPATVEEFARVLAYPKFRLGQAEQAALTAKFLPLAEHVDTPPIPPELAALCRDRDDVVFIALAAQAGVPLVSGDKDLTSLRAIAPVEVLSPVELIGRLTA